MILKDAGLWNRKDHLSSQEAYDSCPSWVPEHRASELGVFIDQSATESSRCNKKWKSHWAQVQCSDADLSSGRILVKGVLVDEVKESIGFESQVVSLSQVQSKLRSCLETYQGMISGCRYPTTEETPEAAFWHMIHTSTDELSKNFSKLFFHRNEERQRLMSGISQVDQDKLATFFSYASHLDNLFSVISFIVTSKYFIGLADGYVKKGDQIVAFCGLSGLFVIRRVADTKDFQLIGRCLLHGMMKGEYYYGDNFEYFPLV